MDAFEQVVAGLFHQEGYWISQGFKVALTKEEKREIGRPSNAKWEIDLVAYKGSTGELLAIECKSYLDSKGVEAAHIISPLSDTSRYKLFVEDTLRRVVLNRLALQLHESGLTPSGLIPKLALVIGKSKSPKDTQLLHDYFAGKDWLLFDANWLASHLEMTANETYFDSVTHVVTKLIHRNPTGTNRFIGDADDFRPSSPQ